MLSKNKLLKLKSLVIEIGKEMYHWNFSAPMDGNISFRYHNFMYITRSANHKAKIESQDISKCMLDGSLIQGKKASSESILHSKVYAMRNDVFGVVHAHPPFATAFAVAGLALDKNSSSEMISTLGSVPLCEYGAPSTEALADSIIPYVKNCNAILLANHGVLAWGKDLDSAWYNMLRVEHFARISFYARLLGGEKELSNSQIDELLEIRRTVYKIKDPQIVKIK
jgi:L-fuculose-phosphate aldolase